MTSELLRLLKNLIAVSIIAIIGYMTYNYFFGSDKDELTIDQTPIHIESIKTIAEIATVSYKDEVVMDSIEFYRSKKSIYDPREWMRIYDRNVKRRLTLIVKGEVKYGIDITDNNYELRSNEDSTWLKLPSPKILDIIISPNRTEIFQETGKWQDTERKRLEVLAKIELKENAENLHLREKAKLNLERLFKTLLDPDKEIIITFNYDYVFYILFINASFIWLFEG